MHLGAGSGLLDGPSQKPVRNQSETSQKCSQKCSQKWPSYAVLYSRMWHAQFSGKVSSEWTDENVSLHARI